jgi:hypothetical protein
MYIPLPTDFLELIGIDLTIGQTVFSLQPFEQAERNQFRDSPSWLLGQNTGQPVYYRVGGTNQAASQVCQLIPYANSAYTYEILYLPVITDLSGDSDTFDGRAGFEEYVVNQAAISVLLNDGNTQTPLYGSILQDRQEMEQEMKFKFATIAGAGRRLDTEAERLRIARYARGDWRSM